MENRNVVLGCGVALVVALLLCGGVIYGLVRIVWYAGEQVTGALKEQIEAEQERQQVAGQWIAPARDAARETLFPEQVAEYTRSSHDDQAAIPELRIDREGRHAVYETGERRIDLYLYPMTSSEADTVFDGIRQLYEADENASRFRSWSTIRTSSAFARAYVHTHELGQNYLWFVQDWLLVFRTEDSTDIEPFVHAYLHATGRAANPETPPNDENP